MLDFAGKTELINTCVVPFAIAELGQECLAAASTQKNEPLNSLIIHSKYLPDSDWLKAHA